MDWTPEECFRLIELYESYPMLWNPKDDYYTSKNKREDAWTSISKELNMEKRIVKQKMSSLLGSFRAQRSRTRKVIATENGRQIIYTSKWFAFERMKFLLNKQESNIVKSESYDEADEIPYTEHYPDEEDFTSVTYPLDNCVLEDRDFLSTTDNIIYRDKRRRISEDHYVNSRVKDIHDHFDLFGQYVATKLRNYARRTALIAEHSINKILFQADLGKYDDPVKITESPSPPLRSVSPYSDVQNNINNDNHE